jgi:hypothetical protein
MWEPVASRLDGPGTIEASSPIRASASRYARAALAEVRGGVRWSMGRAPDSSDAAGQCADLVARTRNVPATVGRCPPSVSVGRAQGPRAVACRRASERHRFDSVLPARTAARNGRQDAENHRPDYRGSRPLALGRAEWSGLHGPEPSGGDGDPSPQTIDRRYGNAPSVSSSTRTLNTNAGRCEGLNAHVLLEPCIPATQMVRNSLSRRNLQQLRIPV